VRPFV